MKSIMIVVVMIIIAIILFSGLGIGIFFAIKNAQSTEKSGGGTGTTPGVAPIAPEGYAQHKTTFATFKNEITNQYMTSKSDGKVSADEPVVGPTEWFSMEIPPDKPTGDFYYIRDSANRFLTEMSDSRVLAQAYPGKEQAWKLIKHVDDTYELISEKGNSIYVNILDRMVSTHGGQIPRGELFDMTTKQV